MTGRAKHSDEFKARVAKIASLPHVKKKLRQRFADGFNPSASPEARVKIAAGCRKEVTCPHCNKVGKSGGMRRWHFDNCKHKED